MREEVMQRAEAAEPADDVPEAAARHAPPAEIAATEPEAEPAGAARDPEAATEPGRVPDSGADADRAAAAPDEETMAGGSATPGPAELPEPDAATPGAEGVSFEIPARMRPEDADAMLARLRGADPAGPLAVDASAVETLSTPAVLGLVAAARARAEGGRALAVERPSPGFIDAFSDLGLFHDLMKMEFRT
ncbi:MAG: STAS domain-containing protein [Paracoccaceae bacterium]